MKNQETHIGDEIEVCANFSEASSTIMWRCGDWCDEDDARRQWQSTPYQVADAGHDGARALAMVDAWVNAQA